MDDVERLIGLGVVGGPVLSVAALGMIRAAVDDSILKNAGAYRGGRVCGAVAER